VVFSGLLASPKPCQAPPPIRERRIHYNHLHFNHLLTLSLFHFSHQFADYSAFGAYSLHELEFNILPADAPALIPLPEVSSVMSMLNS